MAASDEVGGIGDRHSHAMLVDFAKDPQRSMKRLAELAAASGRLIVAEDVFAELAKMAAAPKGSSGEPPCLWHSGPFLTGIQIIKDARLSPGSVVAGLVGP